MLEAVLGLLLLELSCVGLLIAPLAPSTRRGIVRFIEGNSLLSSLRQPAFYFTIALGAACVYCLIQMVNVQGKLDSATAGTELRWTSQLYRAQRDVLLCGSATLLLLVVHRLFALLKEVNQLSASKEALTKQAEGAAAAYKAMSAEAEALKKGGSAPAAPATAKPKATSSDGGDEGGSELEIAHQQIAKLRERTMVLLGERDQAQKDAEALKRQAMGLSDEYGRLLSQKESLENKLADFELVLGDEVKKSK